MNIKEICQENRTHFQTMILKSKKNFSDGNYLRSTYYASFAAGFAWFHHPGLFFSEDLESTLLSTGANEVKNSNTRSINYNFSSDNRLRILHVASEIHDTGGHTREIINWIENSKEQYNNLLVLTRSLSVGSFIETIFRDNKIKIVFLNDTKSNIFSVASKLLKISKEWPDYIILHTHPDDVVPLLTYSSFEGAPILLFNHADHVFWLGSEISDAVLNIRREGLDLSEKRRNTANNLLLPLPLKEKEPLKHKNEEKLFMKNKKIVISLASDYKYTPIEDYSFSNFFDKFLEKRRDVGLIVIGANKNGNLSSLSNKFSERVMLIPPTPNIGYFLSASDIYVDSFPMSSLTSYLDAGMLGIPIVGLKNNIIPFISAEDPAFSDVSFPIFLNSANNLEDELDRLIYSDKEREERGIKIRELIIKSHCGVSWFNLVNKNLKSTKKTSISNKKTLFIDKQLEYDEKLAIFFREINKNEAFAFKSYKWMRQFSYLHLNSVAGKNVENIGHFIENIKRTKNNK